MNDKKEGGRIKHRYIFPNPLARMMKKVDDKTNYESSMMSMTLLLIGMILMGAYTLIYLDQSVVFKVLVAINLIAGFLFMYSFLVTTYQQYYSYMDAMEIQGITPGPKIPSKKNRKNQILFFGGIIFMIIGCAAFFIKSGAGTLYTYKTYISIGSLILGIIMCAMVFRKNKSNVNPGQIKSIKAIPIENPLKQTTTKNTEITSLIEDVKSGLETLKTLPDTPENKPMRDMISEAIKSKMLDLKKLKGGSK